MPLTSEQIELRAAIKEGNRKKLQDLIPQHFNTLAKAGPSRLREIDFLLSDAMIQSPSLDAAYTSCELLFKAGADANKSEYMQSQTGYLHLATRYSLSLAQLFVENGAHINHDLFGKPACWPLISAVCANKLDIVQYLVEKGAVINFVNIWGMSPLDYAVKAEDPAVANYLRSLGAKLGEDLPRDHLPKREAEEDDLGQNHPSIEEHLRFWFGEIEEFPLHEIVPGYPPLRLWKVKEWEGGYSAIVTDGMSAVKTNVPQGDKEGIRRSEMVVLFPRDWPLDEEGMKEDQYRWPIDWLRKCARWPFENDSYYRPWNIVASDDPPVPLGEGTSMTSLLIHVGYQEQWGRWQRPDGEFVELLFVLPLYSSERQYELDHGLDAFVTQWEENWRFDSCNPHRKPFV